MDNYLSFRWPKGPGVQPPPVPAPAARPAAAKKGRRPVRRWLVPAVCVVLCLTLLGGISFWAVNGLAGLLAGAEFPDSYDDPRPRHSRDLPGRSDWSTEDLPWGKPDPSVRLDVERTAGEPLTGREIHRTVLPSIVYIEAQQKDRFVFSSHAGTGVLVTESGYVLTNYHVIEETNTVRVMLLADERTYYDAKVIGFDKEFDIAVLKFDGEGLGLTPARLGDSDALAVGDRVYAEGNPMGYLLGTMTEGIVSALDRESEVDNNGMGLIQTSAALNPGNSGGALLNEQGQVVGITSAKITGLERESGESVENSVIIENLGLAIPISDILPFVNRILATGRSWRPSIGITCFEATVDGQAGIQVATVDEGVPAGQAGLSEDDLIVAANGAAVASLTDLRRVLYRTGVDGEVRCTVVREGEELEISFTLIDKLEESE